MSSSWWAAMGLWRLFGNSELMSRVAPSAKEREAVVQGRRTCRPTRCPRARPETPWRASPCQHEAVCEGPEVHLSWLRLELADGAALRERRPAGYRGQPDVPARGEPDVHPPGRHGQDAGGLVAFATEFTRATANPTEGRPLHVDNRQRQRHVPEGVNDSLSRLGPEYPAKVRSTCGYSRGEDKLVGGHLEGQPRRSKGGGVLLPGGRAINLSSPRVAAGPDDLHLVRPRRLWLKSLRDHGGTVASVLDRHEVRALGQVGHAPANGWQEGRRAPACVLVVSYCGSKAEVHAVLAHQAALGSLRAAVDPMCELPA